MIEDHLVHEHGWDRFEGELYPPSVPMPNDVLLDTVVVKFKRLYSGAKLPTYASDQAAGMDIYAHIEQSDTQDVILLAGGHKVIGSGVAVQLPPGYEGQVRPRSGLAAKHGITVLNSPGTLDSDYRGELKVILINTSNVHYRLHDGDRIAQLVIARVERADGIEVEELDDTRRGTGGFGHTGK